MRCVTTWHRNFADDDVGFGSRQMDEISEMAEGRHRRFAIRLVRKTVSRAMRETEVRNGVSGKKNSIAIIRRELRSNYRARLRLNRPDGMHGPVVVVHPA